MAISSDISDLSWLRQPNPGEFGLRSMQAGLEVGRSFMHAYNSGREQAREDAFTPLRTAMLEKQKMNMALDIQAKIDAQDDYLMNKQAFVKLGEVAKRISENAAWADPKSEAEVWKIASQHPSVMATPQFKHIASQFDQAATAVRMQQLADTAAVKAQGQLALREEALALEKAKLVDTTEKWKTQIASNEKISSEKNAAMIEVAKLRHVQEAKDKLDEMEYRAFSEIADAISEESKLGKITPEAAERKMRAALDRAMENSKTRKGGSAPTSATKKRIFNPATGKIE